jgi:hypothetical protein
MCRRTVLLLFISFCAARLSLQAQEFKLFDRQVQVHGFASQGFVHTTNNNWLTMNTVNIGSGEFTDFGVNAAVEITDKFRVGAQIYDRNLGQLGRWHPSLDWGFADYRFKPWVGVRGGKVKTTLGLYTDTQDLDFLHTFALLPQSIYPTDIRDATIAHMGGDVYGTFSLQRRLGDISYTVYAGHRSDSIYSGIAYVASQYKFYYQSYGGLQYGGDLRWNTPLKGLLIGASRMNEDLTAKAKFINPFNPGGGFIPDAEHSKADWTNQFYGEWTVGKLQIDSEYRRFVNNQVEEVAGSVILETKVDIRGWYVSGAYRIFKRLKVGSYYSRYSVTRDSGGPLGPLFPDQTDTSLPANHIYDKVITARFDLNKFWNAKIEGHFMDGYGNSTYPDGFYPQVNPQGFKPNTNALVLKTSVNF